MLVATVESGSQFRFHYRRRGKVGSFMQMTQRRSREIYKRRRVGTLSAAALEAL